jgi:hypothetical protein
MHECEIRSVHALVERDNAKPTSHCCGITGYLLKLLIMSHSINDAFDSRNPGWRPTRSALQVAEVMYFYRAKTLGWARLLFFRLELRNAWEVSVKRFSIDHIAKGLSERSLSRRSAVAAGGAGLAAMALGQSSRAQQATPVSNENISILFVQVADGGTFIAKTNDPTLFELTLSGVAPQTVWFSDRPERRSGMVETANFAVDPVFDPSDPPNAAIVTNSDTLIVELSNPRFDATAETVTYDAKPVASYAGEGLADHAALQTDTKLTETLGATSLFIDELSCQPEGTACNDGSQCCSGFCTPLSAFPPLTCMNA